MGHVDTVQVVAGAGYVEETDHFGPEVSEIRNESATLYAYGQWSLFQELLNIQFGLAAESFRTKSSFETEALERSQVSPKFGLVWSPRLGTTIRAAAFSAVHRPFIRSQTLEPTQVAGFNQFFSGFEQVFGDFVGTISDRVGIALDQVLSPNAFAGIEVASRRLEVPSFAAERNFNWREETAHGYIYLMSSALSSTGPLAAWQTSMSAEVEYETVERPQNLTGAEGIMELETARAPIGFQFFSRNGVTLRLATTYVEQEGIFSIDVGEEIVEQEDEAWITDVSVEYRLPKRKGLIAIGVRNLFDVSVNLLEIDPFNPRVATRQFVFAKFSLDF